MSHFDDLFWLVAVVDAGTLSAAAEKHGVSTAAVSKRLKLLEKRLTVRLLERNARRLRTTEAGEIYYQRGKRLLDSFAELEETVASTGDSLKGKIHINAPHIFALRRLAIPVAQFMADHPAVTIKMDLNDSVIDLNENDYDLTIRVGKLADSSNIAQRVTQVQLLCCASPQYLKQHGHPTHPNELAQHNCLIYYQHSHLTQWVLYKDDEELKVSVNGNASSNDGEMLTLLATQGRGIVMQPCFIVEQAIRRGELVPLFKDYRGERFGAYVLYPSREHLPLKLSLFIADLKAYFQNLDQTS